MLRAAMPLICRAIRRARCAAALCAICYADSACRHAARHTVRHAATAMPRRILRHAVGAADICCCQRYAPAAAPDVVLQYRQQALLPVALLIRLLYERRLQQAGRQRV